MALRVLLVERRQLNGCLPEAGIDNDSDQERLIGYETDDRETYDEQSDDSDDVDPPAPLGPNILLEDIVEQQQATVERQERMIEFLFQ